MATGLINSNINFFLNNFLSRPATAIPKGALWAISFETQAGSLRNTIYPAIESAYKNEPSGGANWKTQEAAAAILTDDYQKSRGCLFCQAIALPGESMVANVEGNIVSNAFIRSYVGGGRNAFPIMRVTFLDTNTSFCDTFLRGWALATANFGMIARNKSDPKNYRTDLVCHKFGITPEGPFIIQTMTFKGICCIGVSEEEYNYQARTSPVLREAQFVYHSYSVDSSLEQGNDPNIINNTAAVQGKVVPQTEPTIRSETAREKKNPLPNNPPR